VILSFPEAVPSENHRETPERTYVCQERAGQGLLSGARRKVSRWRDRVRSTPGSRQVYRLVVGLVGLAITVGGLFLVPLPGPGWLVVFVGLAILASEFTWAQRVLDLGREQLQRWTRWIRARPAWVQALVGLLTSAFVAVVVYLVAVLLGVPDWIPDSWIPPLPGL
jgi:uncharacterized protein (TIGR02611 family)